MSWWKAARNGKHLSWAHPLDFFMLTWLERSRQFSTITVPRVKDRHSPRSNPLTSIHLHSLLSLPDSESHSRDSIATSAYSVALHYFCHFHCHRDNIDTQEQGSSGVFLAVPGVNDLHQRHHFSNWAPLQYRRTQIIPWRCNVLQIFLQLWMPNYLTSKFGTP